MEIVIIILACIAAFLLLLIIGVSFYFYHAAVGRNKKKYLKKNKDLSQIYESAGGSGSASDTIVQAINTDWIDAQDCETWNITSDNGLKLAGYYIPACTPSDITAILAHGYSANGRTMSAFAKFFHDTMGFNVLMPDARGHGASEGKYIGFGWHERKDYLKWIDKVLERTGDNARIVLFGISMGAATVMSASGEKLPQQVKAIIEDCGFSSLWGELSYQMKRLYKLPTFPFMQLTSLLTHIRAGYSFREVSALQQIKKCSLPMLFIHGEDDTFVPYAMARELYDAYSGKKDMLIIKGAGHGMSYAKGIDAYEGKVKSFVEQYV